MNLTKLWVYGAVEVEDALAEKDAKIARWKQAYDEAIVQLAAALAEVEKLTKELAFMREEADDCRGRKFP